MKETNNRNDLVSKNKLKKSCLKCSGNFWYHLVIEMNFLFENAICLFERVMSTISGR